LALLNFDAGTMAAGDRGLAADPDRTGQRMEGDFTTTLDAHWELISHIQVADVPGRGEPGTGEINYRFLFDHLDALGYAESHE
jgi:sugar phosphate isomerase/epimerase